MQIKTLGRSIRIEDIEFDVVCPVTGCGQEFAIKVIKPQFMRNAGKCHHGTFYFTVTPMQGIVDVNVRFQHGETGAVMGAEIKNVTIAGQPYKGS